MASIWLNHIYKAYPQNETKKRGKKNKEIIKDNKTSIFAVRDFCLKIKDGEFVVLVGPSGCGKSTTLRMIAGLEDITGGELYIDEIFSNNIDASKRNIAMVFQNYALYPNMTSYQNMSYALKLRKIAKPALDKNGNVIYENDKKLIKELKSQIKKSTSIDEINELNEKLKVALEQKNTPKMKMVHYSKEEIDEKVQKAAEILDIKHLLDRKPSDMSGGQRQRVALGRALVRNPKVFLLDEPLSNLDAKLRASMRNEIVKLHEQVKTTFVYVTHDQIEAMTMGDRIVVMKDGLIQQVGSPSQIYDEPINMFVAGFIGTPQMNFFKATLKADTDNIKLTLKNNKEICFKYIDIRQIQNEYLDGTNKDVVLGVRGEHINISKQGLEAVVTFIEILGNTTNILCKLIDDDSEFSISVQERSSLKQGDKIFVNLIGKNIHLFDLNNEQSIFKTKEREEN